MRESLQQVCFTYMQRWVQWFVILLYVGLCLIAVWVGDPRFGSDWDDVSPKPPQTEPKFVVGPPQSLVPADRETPSIDWTVAQSRSPQNDPLQAFPKLKTLHIRGLLKSTEELQVLHSMPHLVHLTLATTVPSDSLQVIGEVPSLHYLKLTKVENNPALSQLRKLSELQILDLGHVDGYSRVVDEICQLPNLNTLVLPGQTAATFQPADWERLRTLPHLRRLYLRGTRTGPLQDQIEIRRVQRALPRIQVRPAEVSERRLFAWNVINGAGVLIWAALSVQLLTQFSHVGSRLIPNYSRDHLTVAASIMGLTTFAHVIILWSRDVEFVASLAASVCVPGLMWWVVAITLAVSSDQNLARRLNPTFALSQFWIIPYFAAYWMSQFLGPVDWFLQGNHPVLALGIVVVSLISPWLVFRRLPRLYMAFAESDAGAPPMSLDLKALSKWNQDVSASTGKSKWSWLNGKSNARLDKQLIRKKPHAMSRLLIAGNETNGFEAVRAILRLGLITAIMFYVLYGRVLIGPDPQRSAIVWSLNGLIWIGFAFLPGTSMIWRRRYAMLGYELLRPIDRRGFVRQLFGAIGRDLLPLLGLHLVLAGVVVAVVAQRGLPPLFIPVVLSYCLFHGLVLYVSTIVLLSVRSELLHGFLIALGFIAIFIASHEVPSAILNPESWYPGWAMAMFTGGSLLAAVCILGLKQYWEDLELA